MASCFCYAQPGEQANTHQYCASLHSDGFVYGCDVSKCSHQCPGQNLDHDVPPQDPEKYAPTKGPGHELTTRKKRLPKKKKVPTFLLGFLVLLAILVVFGLLFWMLEE